ncbi:serine-rich coiled-coil domain-containing protein 1 [Microcaecilia unicolor]|uniref:Serine-rich coiled-coil domain-containing protein 1 n=1 Tax=Microcaecilia unicolor TaxID=1415580 RepID=A0A6P7WTQ0_9AMPH|nr:serine-rich coiled-coil domain-containing protein 1 [Microcaecilia unicolor]XP_030046553.1 serine-rich coiled-coil domain-containing protein 1 [Microcaecilia unicolor]
MGDLGSRRSTLVSRLPIFRKSINRRRDSLPSSPTSNNIEGVHSSSPSSTNSSSGSTEKRRSIFRNPSLSFYQKKGSIEKPDAAGQNVNISNGAQPTHNTAQKLSVEEHVKTKGRTSVCFSGSCKKRITRSVTEDFDKRKESFASKNVFINCLSSGKNESDDSSLTEEQNRHSGKLSTRKLLRKSFSSHYRFSKPEVKSPSNPPVQQTGCLVLTSKPADSEPVVVKPSSLSCSAEITECAEQSLSSPLLSTNHTTTLQTPSEFLMFIDDSLSETDALPNSGNAPLYTENFGHVIATSQIFLNSPAGLIKQISDHTDHINPISENSMSMCDSLKNNEGSHTSLGSSEGLLPPSELLSSDVGDNVPGDAQSETFVVQNGEYLQTSEGSPKTYGLLEGQCETAMTEQINENSLQGSKILFSAADDQHHMKRHSQEAWHARVNYSNSFSPYREGRFTERRLRSSSEGTAGGSRMTFKAKDGNFEELHILRKQRTSSTSSKMSSLDVLNNLGSCELDEDDLMLELESLEEPNRHPSVSRDDSFQRIVSCSAVVHSTTDKVPELKKNEEPKMPEAAKMNLSLHLSKEADQGEPRWHRVSQMPSSPSVDWPGAGLEESTGMESLPFRLMLQDCTSVKSLLFKMKRILQESADMSPASSTASLPMSPIAENPFPFKDIMKDECSMLKLQLKERDELVFQLREELAKVHLEKPTTSQLDKSTQTEFVGHDAWWNCASTEGSVYKAIQPVHCFQHYQIKTSIWTQDSFH